MFSATLLMIVNGLLGILLFLFYLVYREKWGAGSHPEKYYAIFSFLQFLVMILITPALVGGTIAGERESGRLDVLMTGPMPTWRIVTGKYVSVMEQILLLHVSTLPFLAVALPGSGMGAARAAVLMLFTFGMCLFIASVSLLLSALCRRASTGVTVSYAAALLLSVGTLLLAPWGSSRGTPVTLLLNPFTDLGWLLRVQTGRDSLLAEALQLLPMSVHGDYSDAFFYLSIAVKALATGFCLVGARLFLDSRRRGI